METIDWSKLFSLSFKVIKEPYFQSFQYKVLNRIINCKDKLYTWRITDNNNCVYCNDIDTQEHHFFYCNESTNFWKLVSKWTKENLDTSFNLTICEIMFGIPIDYNQTIKAINFMIILGKWFINNSRSLDIPINFQNNLAFLKTKIDQMILNKTIINVDPHLWEIDLLIAL